MRNRTKIWQKLAARGNFTMETRAKIGDKYYSAISAPNIDRVLMDAPLSVGNCSAATLSLSIKTDDTIPTSQAIIIEGRLIKGQLKSEWLVFGTFYISRRDTSYEGLLTVKCFDSMLKASQDFITEFETEINYPRSMIDIVSEIAERIGVGIDPRTKIKTGADYVISYPSGRTMLEVLGFIGACHGGNWIITEDNLLRLVPLVSSPDDTFHVIDEDYNRIKTAGDDLLVHMQRSSHNVVLPPVAGNTPSSDMQITHYITDEHGSKIVTSDGHLLVWAEDGSIDAEDGIINVPVVCGKLDIGESAVVSGVSVSDDAGNAYTAGDKSGLTLVIENNPYASQQICDDLYDAYNGLVYSPFDATKAAYDPATELGDKVVIGDKVRSVLYHQSIIFDLDFRADISAPSNEELQEEYPYLSEVKKTEVLINKVKEENRLNFEIASEGITAEVTRAKGAESSLSSLITQTAESISSEVSRAQGAENSLSSLITQTAESISTKVSKDDLVSEINQSSELISISSNRIKIDSTNFTLSPSGEVVAKKIQAEGTLTSTNASTDRKSTVTNGAVKFYEGSVLSGQLNSTVGAQGSNSSLYQVLDLETDSAGIVFSVGTTYYLALNDGVNPGDYTERFLVLCNSRFRDRVHLGSSVKFDAGNPDGDNTNLIFLSDGTICTNGGAYVGGDFYVAGAKNRIVETENYGTLSLNAVESTSAVFTDLGSGVLDESGICEVFFDPKFFETIDTSADYLTFITQTSNGAISYTEKQKNYFTVKGVPGTHFDWALFAKQKNYANTYLDFVDNPQYVDDSADDSVFMGDNNSSINSEDYMDSFSDDLDEQAQLYLEQYEREIF